MIVDLTPPPPGAFANEKQWQAEVENAAPHYGWYCLHLRNAITNPTLPDLLCWRGEDESLLLELKVGKNPVTAVQQRMIDRFAAFGKTVHVLRWPEPDVWDRLLALLRGKAR